MTWHGCIVVALNGRDGAKKCALIHYQFKKNTPLSWGVLRSILFREHDRHHARGDQGITRVRGAVPLVNVVVVDLPDNTFVTDRQRGAVVFPVGIIMRRERVECRHLT